jgi:hypothetical protein
MDRRPSAVLARVFAGRTAPYVAVVMGSVAFLLSWADSERLRLATSGALTRRPVVGLGRRPRKVR